MKKGMLRKYYYERYENFQYQLMIIAGGTLTVFISFNRESNILPLYKWGFALLGLSLVAGAISIFMFQIHIVLNAERNEEIEKEFQKSDQESHRVALNIYKRMINGCFTSGQIVFGFLQLTLFLTGLILIIIGLINT